MCWVWQQWQQEILVREFAVFHFSADDDISGSIANQMCLSWTTLWEQADYKYLWVVFFCLLISLKLKLKLYKAIHMAIQPHKSANTSSHSPKAEHVFMTEIYCATGCISLKIHCCLICVCLVSLYYAVRLHENCFFAYFIYFKSDTRQEEGLRGGWHSTLDISGDSCTNHQHHRCTSRMSGG